MGMNEVDHTSAAMLPRRFELRSIIDAPHLILALSARVGDNHLTNLNETRDDQQMTLA